MRKQAGMQFYYIYTCNIHYLLIVSHRVKLISSCVRRRSFHSLASFVVIRDEKCHSVPKKLKQKWFDISYNIAATQHPTAASVFFSLGISINRLPDPQSRAMYTRTGIATAATTVQTEAQHDFRPSVFIRGKIIP